MYVPYKHLKSDVCSLQTPYKHLGRVMYVPCKHLNVFLQPVLILRGPVAQKQNKIKIPASSKRMPVTPMEISVRLPLRSCPKGLFMHASLYPLRMYYSVD